MLRSLKALIGTSVALTPLAVLILSPSPNKILRRTSKVASLVMLKSPSHSKRTAEIPVDPVLISTKDALSSRNLSTLATRVTSLSLVMSTRTLSNSRLRPPWVDLLLSFQPQPRELLVLKTNSRASRKTKRRKSPNQNPRDLPSSLAPLRVSLIDRTKTMPRPTRTCQKSRRSLPSRSRSMRLSLLARKESRANIIIMRLERKAMAARERVNNTSLIINKTMTTTMIPTALSTLRRRKSAEVTVEADAAELAVAAVASIVTMITSTAEVVTDPKLITVMRDPKRLSKPQRPLLHRRKKRSRLLSLLRNSLVGVRLLSFDRSI